MGSSRIVDKRGAYDFAKNISLNRKKLGSYTSCSWLLKFTFSKIIEAIATERKSEEWPLYPVADPGFPRRRRGNFKGKCHNQFFPANWMKMKKFWSGGGTSLASPRSANGTHSLCQRQCDHRHNVKI